MQYQFWHIRLYYYEQAIKRTLQWQRDACMYMSGAYAGMSQDNKDNW